MNNFDRIAPIYDLLARFVFGRSLERAATHFNPTIDAGASVLVLGGGSGRLLSSLDRQQVTYVDKSMKMLELARRRTRNNITFVHEDFLLWESEQTYDVIICPFFLDVFESDQLKHVIRKIRTLLRESGVLLIADFDHSDKPWHRVLLKLMHIFFDWVAQLESQELQPIKQVLMQLGFHIEDEANYYNGMVFSCKLKRTKCG